MYTMLARQNWDCVTMATTNKAAVVFTYPVFIPIITKSCLVLNLIKCLFNS